MPTSTRKAQRSVKPSTKPVAKQPEPCRGPTPPKADVRTDIVIDMSRREAFLQLPLEERDRRLEAFRKAFAPAFADYSSDDFRADQRREAERD